MGPLYRALFMPKKTDRLEFAGTAFGFTETGKSELAVTRL